MPELLQVLHSDVAARTGEIAASNPGWPCRKGCDTCCRRLAAIPTLTAPEWHLLGPALDALPSATRAAVAGRMRALSDAPPPLVCPLLDPATGACLVYDVRPVACRTYGFYRERGRGLFCGLIQALDVRGACDGVVWGNAEAIDARLASLGPSLPLTAWYENESR